MNLSENIANPPQNPIIHHHILRQIAMNWGVKHIGINMTQNVLCIYYGNSYESGKSLRAIACSASTQGS